MQKLLLGYRDNMRVEVETGVAITAKTVADLRALSTWPDGLVLSVHVDLDPRLSIVTWSVHPDPTTLLPAALAASGAEMAAFLAETEPENPRT